ncbi:Probable mitochondrial import inner membrane translocase subunit TIM21 [Linum perenne]
MQGLRRKSALLFKGISQTRLSSHLHHHNHHHVPSTAFSSSSTAARKSAISPLLNTTISMAASNSRGFLSGATHMTQRESRQANGLLIFRTGWNRRQSITGFGTPFQLLQKDSKKQSTSQLFARSYASRVPRKAEQSRSETKKDVSTVEDPFDAPTYNIPEKPVTFTEGASYTLVILVGLGLAAAAGYAVFKELIFEPKEYKIFNMALKRIQEESQVRVRIGSPITGYGQESRNRAARQRIPNKIYTDEDGVEHVLVSFHIRGPHGAGKVSAEMFKDKEDKQWKYTYLIVQITHPSQSQLILESYIPAPVSVPAMGR